MQKRYLTNCLPTVGLLVILPLLCPSASADPYSGLSGPRAEPYGAGNTTGPPVSTDPSGRQLGSSSVAGTPEAPTPTTRPDAWPGQMPQDPKYPTTGYAPEPWNRVPRSNSGNLKVPTASMDTVAPVNSRNLCEPVEAKACEETKLLGRVGSEVILAGDIMALFVEKNLDRLKEPLPEETRAKLMEHWLGRTVVSKLMYLEAKRSIPEENFPKVQEQISKYFFKEAMPQLMKKAKVASRSELEKRLVELGTSLEWQQRLFMERTLGQQWMRDNVVVNDPVTPEQMLTHYREHLDGYKHTARARWEEVMVSFTKSPSREAAYQKLAELGNRVKNGLPFAEAARRGSDGATAANGGERDWTNQGSLVSDELDRALFGLPAGQLSPIIETQKGLYIIRVIKQEPTHWTPYTEVQNEIREAIQDERLEGRFQECLAELKGNTPVWTIYDKKAEVAQKNSRNSNAPETR